VSRIAVSMALGRIRHIRSPIRSPGLEMRDGLARESTVKKHRQYAHRRVAGHRFDPVDAPATHH